MYKPYQKVLHFYFFVRVKFIFYFSALTSFLPSYKIHPAALYFSQEIKNFHIFQSINLITAIKLGNQVREQNTEHSSPSKSDIME